MDEIMKAAWFTLFLLLGLMLLATGTMALSSALPVHNSKRSISTMCPVALRIDCANDYIQQTDETLCGTNGLSYVNLCFFSKDKCTEPHLNILHFGACPKAETSLPSPVAAALTPLTTTAAALQSQPPMTAVASSSTTTKTPLPPPTTTTTSTIPTTTLDEYEILRRVFCAPESQVDCSLFQRAPYCGSNFVVYDNECDFVKAQCTLDIKAMDAAYCHEAARNHHEQAHHHHNPHEG